MERLMEDGYEIVETPLPCVITVVKEINSPRLPSLKGKMRAKNATIVKWGVKDIGCDLHSVGLEGSPTRVVKIFTPPPRKSGEILQGEVSDISKKLVDLLKTELH